MGGICLIRIIFRPAELRSHDLQVTLPFTPISLNSQMQRPKAVIPKNTTISPVNRLHPTFIFLGLVAIHCHPFPSLAEPHSKTFQELVAQNAINEWVDFNTPNRPIVKSSADVSLLERNPLEFSKCLRINQFWAAVPARDNRPPNGNTCAFNIPQNPQGKGQVTKWNVFPWSAAFISYIMKASGAGTAFKYSGRHATYIVDAVKNRNTPKYPFRGYPFNEQKPEIGDLICAPRGANKGLTYGRILQTGDFQSHCDIVVAKTNRTIEVIGGNVGDTVAKTIVALNANGYINKSPDSAFRGWFVVIKNAVRP